MTRRRARSLDSRNCLWIANHTRFHGASRQYTAARARRPGRSGRTADEPARGRRDSSEDRRARLRRLDFRLLRPGSLLVPAGPGCARTPSDARAVVDCAGYIAADDGARRSHFRLPRRSLRAQANDRSHGRYLRRRHRAVRIEPNAPPTDRVSIDNRARDGRWMGPRTKSGCRKRAGRAPRAIRRIRADRIAARGLVGGGGGRLSRTRDRMASDVHGFRHSRRICRRRRAEVDAGERRMAAHARES